MATYDFAQISKKEKKNKHEIDKVLVHRDDGMGGGGCEGSRRDKHTSWKL